MSDKKKKILLVESPTKVNTIKKFLDNNFKVMATKGHIKDLPKSKLGVDIENNFTPTYIVMKDKKKILSEIKKEAEKAEAIYIGTDPDREGEAIGYHIADEICKKEEKKVYRVLFNEITQNAVLNAIKSPKEINKNLVYAQQARRILDRLVGYKISPMLWKVIRRGLSAGRVQSVALKLIVERQREIDNFKPEEYWQIKARLKGSSDSEFEAMLTEKNNEKIKIKTKEESENIINELKTQDFIVTEVIKKERIRKALPPFITSTLQQEASRKFKYTAQKTMMIAQQLYEGIDIKGEGQIGLITYMRTDSLRVSSDAQKSTLEFIRTKYGEKYVPDTPNFYKSKKSAQDAHEAIRPTSINREPEKIKDSLTPEQYKIYSLIYKRFLASQMTPAIYDDTKVKIAAGIYGFSATGSILKFDGFLKVYDIIVENEENKEDSDIEKKENGKQKNLPELYKGEKLILLELINTQHFTQPPPFYTDASLVKILEEKDIGRPSTYAPIIATLIYRKYVIRENGKFIPTELGILVNDILEKHFPEIINVEFTAKMEDNLDAVEEGMVEWHQLLKDFYTEFEKTLEKAKPFMEDIKKNLEGETGEKCELCGGKMIVKWGRHGKFISCENYPKCKNAKSLNPEKREEEKIDEKCPKCGSDLVVKFGPFGKFIACSKYPECKYTKNVINKIGIQCPECGGDIIERTTKKRRKFYGCSNYPKCKFMVWDKPVNEKCPECGAALLFEKRKKDSVIIYCNKCNYKKQVDDNKQNEK